MDSLQQHLQHVLRRSGLQPADREDVAQEALLRLTRAKARTLVRDPQAFATRTALRLVVDRWRDRARHNGELPAGAAEPVAAPVPTPQPAAVQALYAALAKLPPRQAAVVTLRKLWELEYPAIAELLGISVANCRSHCRHGLARLRQMLEASGDLGE